MSRLGPTPCQRWRVGDSSSLALRRKFPVSSVAIRNVPHAPVIVTGQRHPSFTDCFALLCLSEHVCLNAFHCCKDHGVGASFVDDETVSDFVAVLHVLGKCVVCVHAFIIGGDAVNWSRGRPLRQVSPSPSALLPVCLSSRSWRLPLVQRRDGRRRSCWWHTRNRARPTLPTMQVAQRRGAVLRLVV